jgi:hypothetical protein
MDELHEEIIVGSNAVTVVLSARSRNVEFEVELEEVNAVVYCGPPGRVVLFGAPY